MDTQKANLRKRAFPPFGRCIRPYEKFWSAGVSTSLCKGIVFPVQRGTLSKWSPMELEPSLKTSYLTAADRRMREDEGDAGHSSRSASCKPAVSERSESVCDRWVLCLPRAAWLPWVGFVDSNGRIIFYIGASLWFDKITVSGIWVVS